MRIAKAAFSDEAGMTVVEVIIALGIITVGLLALVAAMPFSTSQIGQANLKTTATFLAQQRLEQIKNAQWTSATDTLGGAGSDGTAAVSVPGFADRWPNEGYDTIAFPGAAACGATAQSGGCRFRRQVRIADCSVLSCTGIATGAAGINTLRQVTVTVFFFPLTGTGMRSATEESLQLTTLITRRP
jgi:type II secretory pathway pseudopilin PulG